MSLLLLTGAGSGGNPDALAPNLAVWLDAQSASTLTFSTGSDVSQWSDKSGNGNHLSQGTASRQPLYVASGVKGLPSVQFYDDSTLKTLALADNATLDYTTYSAYIVAQRVTDLGAEECLFGKQKNTGNQREWRMNLSNTDVLQVFQSNNGTAVTTVNNTSATPAVGTAFIGDAQYDGTTLTVGYNRGTTNSGAVAAVFNGTASFFVGAFEPSAGSPFAGYIGEVLFYTSVNSAAQRLAILSYLASKWGVTLT